MLIINNDKNIYNNNNIKIIIIMPFSERFEKEKWIWN